jgi:hypothetical protein
MEAKRVLRLAGYIPRELATSMCNANSSSASKLLSSGGRGIFDERVSIPLLVALKILSMTNAAITGESDGDNEQTEQHHHRASGIWKDRFISRRDAMHVSRCRFETTSR